MKIVNLIVLSTILIVFSQFCDAQVRAVATPAVRSDAGSPKSSKPETLIFVMEKSGIFTVFLNAIRQAGFEDKLTKEGPFTLLAPRDAAFANVNSVSREELFSKSNLKRFVEQHIIPGQLSMADLAQKESLIALSGVALSIEHKDPIEIEHAPVIREELVAQNGVIFVLGQANMAD